MTTHDRYTAYMTLATAVMIALALIVIDLITSC